jgi:hypothetical protein
MKNFAAKLKGLNYKQLVIEHGEKFVLGTIGLLVLICLAGTSWSRYDKEPEEFLKKAEQGETNLRNSNWTAEKRKEFESNRDIMQSVQLLQSPVEAGRFEYSTNWFWPMYPAVLKVSEPKWFAPIEPIATFGRIVMVELPPAAAQNNEMIAGIPEGSPAAKRNDATEDDEFKIRRAPNAIGSGIPGAPGSGDTTTVAPATNPLTRFSGSSSGSSDIMMGAGSGQATVRARGVRYIAVRAAVPLGEQLDEIVKTMHETKQNASKLIEYLDFEIQRQTAKPGKEPWSNMEEDWDKVDLQAALEMLDRIDFDTELVDLAYTDPVFTMPLPRRVLGNWTKDASHPLIKAMTLQQAEAQRLLTEKMLEEAEKQRALQAGTAKKGFASKVVDGRGLRTQLSSQIGTMMTSMRTEMQSNPMGAPGYLDRMPGGMDGFIDSYQAQVNQSGDGRMSKYLLFRYFDFQVTPGNAYRYRIRMTLRNPNYRRPVEELVDESIAAGEVRVTPWSEPTPPVYIPEEQKIFLTKTDKARAETGLPSAFLDVYQWFAEAGTTIAAKLERLQLGQFVGGWSTNTEVYRPATDQLVNESVPVYTGSLLTDLAPTAAPTDFDFSEHADLKLDLKKLRQLDVVDRALLVDRFGELVTLNPKASIDERAAAEAQVDRERAGVRARMKERPQLTDPAGGDLASMRMMYAGSSDDDMSARMGMMGMMGSGSGMMPGMGGGNALRKGAKRPTGAKSPRGAGSSSSGP